MQNFLQEIVAGNLFAFLLIFMRFGTALMIMPGIGDSFVSPVTRLLFALAMSFILTPVLAAHLPAIPVNTGALLALLAAEAFIGIFIGTVMRILMTALDTAGTVISLQAGLSNATLFSPATETQASIMSVAYTTLGVTVLLAADFHHRMLASVVESYQLYPANGAFPAMGDMLEIVSKAATVAFKIGVQISVPFLVVGTLMQVGFGVLGRLMPQLQIFFLAMPVQIFLSLVILALTISAGIIYWLNGYEAVLYQSLNP